MTNYPNSQDNIITLPSVTGSSQEDIAINALRGATLAIENELGITPSGIYTDVRARFDILEARINNPSSPTVLSDGYVNSPLFIVNSPASLTVSISDGYGFPTENRINGSLYLRNDGYVNQGLYSRRGGVWKEVSTDPWTASGDLSGTYLSQTVIGLRGKILHSSLATIGALQDGYVLTWDQADGYWVPRASGILLIGTAGGDLFGTYPNPTVIKINGTSVPSTPNVNQLIVSTSGTTAMWTQIYDGYIASAANIAGTKIAPNFGSQIIQTTGSAYIGNTGQAGLTDSIINIGTSTGTVTSVVNQALLYNSAGKVTLQGHAGSNFITNTTLIASTNTAKFITNAGRRLQTTLTTTNLTIIDGYDIILVGTLSGSITVTLPASPTTGDTYTIKDQNGGAAVNNIIVSGNGNNIDGAATSTINANYGSMTVIFGNSRWGII